MIRLFRWRKAGRWVHLGTLKPIDVHTGGGSVCIHVRKWRIAGYVPREDISRRRSEATSSVKGYSCMQAYMQAGIACKYA